MKFVMLPVRFLLAFCKEVVVMFSGGSVFLDSPLNETGVAQAKGLLKFLEGEGQSNPHVAIMTGKASRKSVVVTSNLRRCIETATIGLWGRFHEGKDKILLLSDLQEASPNVDTYSLSKPMGLPPLKQLPAHVNSKFEKVESLLEVAGNGGQKKMFESGLKRLQVLCISLLYTHACVSILQGRGACPGIRLLGICSLPLALPEGHAPSDMRCRDTH
jgi:hypothetical protein